MRLSARGIFTLFVMLLGFCSTAGADPLVGRWSLGGISLISPQLDGDLLYAAHAFAARQSRFFDILVFDIARPSFPRLAGQISVTGSFRTMRKRGHHLFVLTEEDHVMVIDVANPEAPQLIADLDLPADEILLILPLEYFLFALPLRGAPLQIDIVDPARPSVIGRTDSIPDQIFGSTIIENQLYFSIAEQSGTRLNVLDERLRPILYDVPLVPGDHRFSDFYRDGDRLYAVGRDPRSIASLELRGDHDVSLLAVLETALFPGFSERFIGFKDRHVYALLSTDGGTQVNLIKADVSALDAPRIVAWTPIRLRFSPSPWVTGGFLHGDHVILVLAEEGILIFDL